MAGFISIGPNRSVDGDVIELIPDSNDPNVLTFSTISNPTFPIQFPKGRNGPVPKVYKSCWSTEL